METRQYQYLLDVKLHISHISLTMAIQTISCDQKIKSLSFPYLVQSVSYLNFIYSASLINAKMYFILQEGHDETRTRLRQT